MGHKDRYRLLLGLPQLNKHRFMDYKQSLFFGEVRRPDGALSSKLTFADFFITAADFAEKGELLFF